MSWSNIETDDLPVMERRRWLINIICTTVVVAILFVALRLFSRRLMRQKIWWDDYFIIFALLGYISNIVIAGVLLSLGLGRHFAQVSPSLLPTSNKLHLAGQLLYQWSMMAAKTSILLMYYRIFKIMPYFRAAASLVFALVLLTALVFSFVYPFLCDPVAKLFDPSLEGHCISTKAVGIVNGSINILTDILTLCLPFPQVWVLPLKRMERVTVSIAFALGLLDLRAFASVVFASSYRIYVFHEINPKDTTYGLVPILGWSLIDCFAAILSACLPVMKPVLFFLLDKLHLRGERGLLSRFSLIGTMTTTTAATNRKTSQGGREDGAAYGSSGGGGTTWTGEDATTVRGLSLSLSASASASASSGPRKGFPRRASQASYCLDYTEARRHWSVSDTLRGDLAREGHEEDGEEDGEEEEEEEEDVEDVEAAVHFQTMCILKSDN